MMSVGAAHLPAPVVTNLAESAQPQEARTAIVLEKNSTAWTHNDRIQWLLDRMARPLPAVSTDQERAFIYMSSSAKTIWEAPLDVPMSPMPSSGSGDYMITPRTNILSLAATHSMALMLDLSSSLATIDATRDHVMLEDTFGLLSNALNGLVHPFYLPTTHGPLLKVEPCASITVIAECSQFGSNINVIPILAEYPTMRVLLQNVSVSRSTVGAVLKELHHEISAFLYDLGKIRHQISQRRVKLGYQLDVRYDRAMVVDEGDDPDYHYDVAAANEDVQPPTTPDPNSKKKRHSRKSSSSSVMTKRRSHHHHHQHQHHQDHQRRPSSQRRASKGFNSWKKDVWGVGKTGSNLSYILRAGAFALSLLPAHGRRSILLVTDGVVKSTVDESVLRQLAADDIACHVIHLGPESGYSPTCNFGFVPDTEILQFITNATGGHFDHASDILPAPLPMEASPPNRYHLRILARPIVLEKPRNEHHRHHHHQTPRFLASNNQMMGGGYGHFPWTTNDVPVPMDTRLLRYQEYALAHDDQVALFVAARLRQGFALVSILLDDGKAADAQGKPRKARATIILALQWQPNVTIEYRIRARVAPNWFFFDPSTTTASATPDESDKKIIEFYSALHAPKAELLIRANVTFSEMLKNWDHFQRRMQVMGLVHGNNSGSGMEIAGATAGFSKVGKLKRLLDRIADTDAALSSMLAIQDKSDAFYNRWVKLNDSDLRHHTRNWYDDASIDLVTSEKDIHTQKQDIAAVATDTEPATPSPSDTNHDTQDDDASLDAMLFAVEAWATYAMDDNQVFVKVHAQHDPAAPLQFCEVRLFKEKSQLVTARLLFFNMDQSLRRQYHQELQLLLLSSCLTTTSSESSLELLTVPAAAATNMPLSPQPQPQQLQQQQQQQQQNDRFAWIVHRPLASLLMRDPDHYMAASDDMLQQKQMHMSMWHGNSTLWITGEYIVRNYLYHNTIHWNLQNHGPSPTTPSLLSLAFEFMCQARRHQGFVVLSCQPNAVHFYKEVVGAARGTFAAQCYLWKEDVKMEILSELWMEPSSMDGKAHRMLEIDMHRLDKELLTALVTFDHISALRHDCSLTRQPDRLSHSIETRNRLLNVQHIDQQQLFYLPSLINTASFWLASFPFPKFALNDVYHEPDQGTPSTLTMDLLSDDVADRWKHNACICSVSDASFYKHSRAISLLSPSLRHVAFLHYFMEYELKLVADYQIPFDTMVEDDVYWRTLWHKMRAKEPNMVLGSLSLVHALPDMNCFVKSISETSFLLLFAPSLQAVITALQQQQQQQLRSGSHTVTHDAFTDGGILMYECERPTRPELHADPDALRMREIKASVPLNDDSGLPPHAIWQGDYQTEQKDPSPTLASLLANVMHAYAKSVVKSTFTSLLKGRVVDAADFDNALAYCSESVMEIDITGYLNVQTLLQRHGTSRPQEIDFAHRRFIAVLGYFFEPVVTTQGQHPSIYCYRPEYTKTGHVDDADAPKRSSTLLDMVQCAQNPLFVRLECQFKKRDADGQWIERTFSFDQVPSSYQQPGIDIDFEPDVIGNDASPVASADGTTATLRLVCLTLPLADQEAAEIHQSVHRTDCPAGHSPLHHQLNASYLESKQKYAAELANLNIDKQDALLETEQRLVWHFTEEILHSLLRAGPVTPTAIRYVETQLMKKNSFVDFPTTMSIPLVFVKNHSKSRRTFLSELENVTNAPYRLIRMGDAFYAQALMDTGLLVDMHASSLDQSAPLDDEYHLEGLNISLDPSKAMHASSSRSNDYCHGLGISLMPPSASSVDDDNADDDQFAHHGLSDINNDEDDAGAGLGIVTSPAPLDLPMATSLNQHSTQQQSQQQLYWLLLIPQKQSVQIYFYSKMQLPVARSEIIRITKNMVKDVMERTNQMVLLQALHDTRVCSKYLIAPEQQPGGKQHDSSTTDDSSSSSSGSDDDGDDHSSPSERQATKPSDDYLVDILSTSAEDKAHTPPKKFLPGHFQCPCLLKKRVPLHWRLQPNAALAFLASEVLRFGAVRNRPNMYVMMNDDQVIYCYLSEGAALHPVDTDSQNDSDSMRPSSPYGSSFLDLNGTSTTNNTIGPHSRLHTASSFSFGHTPHGSPHSDNRLSPKVPSPSGRNGNNNSAANGGDSGSTQSPSYKKRASEMRELTVEVYGVQFGTWISEFVDMLESRLTTQLTMKEVQQFLTRNPTSKLSRADIEFMLPVSKPPSFRRTLSIPPLVNNLAHFLTLLNQNIVVGPLRPLDGTDLMALIRRHRMLRYGSYSGPLGPTVSAANGHDLQLQDLCFYYSCISRTPGKCTPFEFSVGEGVAGICCTLLDEHGIFVTHVARGGSRHASSSFSDDALLAAQLRDDLDVDVDAPNGTFDGYRLSIDIWPIGQLNGTLLLDYVGACFKQTICDYIVEQTIQSAATMDDFFDHPQHPPSPLSIGGITNSFLRVLDTAVAWQSPTVKRSSWQTRLAPWTMQNVLQRLDNELSAIHGTRPIITRAPLSAQKDDGVTDHHEIYELPSHLPQKGSRSRTSRRHAPPLPSHHHLAHEIHAGLHASHHHHPHHYHQNQDQRQSHHADDENNPAQHYRYMVVGGLPELGLVSGASSRRHSSESHWSSHLSKKQQAPSPLAAATTSNHHEEVHQRQDSVASSMSKSGTLQKKLNSREMDHHHSFVLFIVDCDRTTAYAYNCTDTLFDQVFSMARRAIVQEEARHLALGNILHQKMGLFHHAHTMNDILTAAATVAQASHRRYQQPLAHWIHDAAAAPPTEQALQASSSSLADKDQDDQNDDALLVPASANVSPLVNATSTTTSTSIARLAQQSQELMTPVASSARLRSLTTDSADTQQQNSKIEVNFSTLKQLVANNFISTLTNPQHPHQQNQKPPSVADQPHPSSSSMVEKEGSSIFDIEDSGRLCKSPKVELPTNQASLASAPNVNIINSDITPGSASSIHPHPSNDANGEVIYTAVRLADGNTVLRDAYAPSTTEFAHAQDKDYLMRHGEPFLTIYLRRARLQSAHDKAFKVYTKWADRYTSIDGKDTNSAEMMNEAELRVILKASRLLHFCRTPLLLADMEPLWVTVSSNANTSANANANVTSSMTCELPASLLSWYENLTETFMREYAAYLQAVGMHLIVFGKANDAEDEKDDENDPFVSKYGIPRLVSVASPVTYLLQVFRGGTILCEARFTGTFVSVTLYTLHRRYGRITFSPYTHEKHQARRAGFQDFTEECDRFKQRIHVNSFVADFSLRYLQHTLDHLDTALPVGETHRHLLALVHQLAAAHTKKERLGGYTRNRIVRGSYVLDLSKRPTPALLDTLFKNCTDFGMRALMQTSESDTDIALACYVSSNDLSFDAENDPVALENAPFRHTLIVAPAFDDDTNDGGNNDAHLRLVYYVMVTFQGMHTSSWRDAVHSLPEQWKHYLNEQLDHHTLEKVIKHALARIDNLVEQAIARCDLDSGWQRLLQSVQQQQAVGQRVDHAQLPVARQFPRIEIDAAMDAPLASLLQLVLPWPAILDGLKQLHAPAAGELTCGSPHQRCVLIYVGDADAYFVSLEYNAHDTTQPLRIYANSKHRRTSTDHNDLLTHDEKVFLGKLTTSICYLVWRAH